MLRRPLALSIALCLAACAAPPPLGCTSAIDGSGRGIPICNASNEIPVCDLPGQMARFTTTTTASLEGGTLALCDSSNQIVCSDRTVLPHCLTRPEPE